MFTYRYAICFDDVDAAGIVYYPRYFHFCHLALEALFAQKAPVSYPELIYQRRIGLPIVHVEADYKHPIFYGDSIDIAISCKAIKTSSMITEYRFLDVNREMFVGNITTVCIDLETKKAMSVPEDLRKFFDGLNRGR